MLYGEKMAEIIQKIGINPETLEDRLYSTLLSCIYEKASPAVYRGNAYVAEAASATIGEIYTALKTGIDTTAARLPCVVTFINKKPIEELLAYEVVQADYYICVDGTIKGVSVVRRGATSSDFTFGATGTFNESATTTNYNISLGESFDAYYIPQ